MARRNLLKGFKRPKSVEFEKDRLTETYGRFLAYPFETGFGTTVGNTLRRILLSSIQGYAITAVRIVYYTRDDSPRTVSSEFENIPGVSEDTLEILSRLRAMIVKLPNEDEGGTFLFDFNNQGVIKNTSFSRDGNIEILGDEFEVMHLMPGVHIEVELQVDLARGFVSAEMNEEYVDVIGTIPLDAVFSPVRRVSYTIESCRVGQRSDYDKLILEVWTNGVVAPDDALGEAAKIAKEHFTVFINFNEDTVEEDDELDNQDLAVTQLLAMPVEKLELTVRAMNVLDKAEIKTLGELVKRSEEEIASMRNVGKKCLSEIQEKLAEYNLALGMTDYSHLRDSILTQQKEETDEA